MLKSISYSVTFPTTGRIFQNDIEFAPGLTTITGRNEAGKSLILEMISYALFGKAALRGEAADYKNLAVELVGEFKGEDWKIVRAPRRESLTINGEVVAVGTDATNKEVPARLGFGLDVWNVACAAQQGNLEEFTNMKPTARRQMVDRLVNLDQIEEVEKACKQEAKTAEAVATNLLATATQPIEPAMPEEYRPSAELEEAIAECEMHEADRLCLSQIQKPIEPIAPDPVEGDVDELEAHEAERQKVLQAVARMGGQLDAIPEPTVSAEVLAQALAYKEYQDECTRRGPKPDYPVEQLNEWLAILDAQEIETEAVVCPECDHEFHPGLSTTQEELRLGVSPLGRRTIREQLDCHLIWNNRRPLDEVQEVIVPHLQQEIIAHAQSADRDALRAALEATPIPDDRSAALRDARNYRSALAIYEERATRYAVDQTHYEDAQRQLEGMADRSEDLVSLRQRLATARNYEVALGRYADERTRYEDLVERARAQSEQGNGFKAGAEALKTVRLRVKQNLVPSLSQAASSLLSMMTNGERRQVIVDEDFNVTVDGQRVNTLSGSGKSVVNLALRIGLGQVLTSQVVPIFLGDEIDAAMDADRAGSTLETMNNLKAYLKQIILVTHKDLEADTIIRL